MGGGSVGRHFFSFHPVLSDLRKNPTFNKIPGLLLKITYVHESLKHPGIVKKKMLWH